jgi:nucleotide-binding universal stress UspA family protein
MRNAAMTLKDLFLVIDDGPRSGDVLRVAVQLARAHGAHLSAGCPLELLAEPRGAMPALAVVEPSDIRPRREDLMEVAAERSRHVEDAFIQASREAGVLHTWCDDLWALPSDAIAKARLADLVVVGQVNPAADAPPASRRLPEALLTESGRPLLIVPYAGSPDPTFHRILVGWDGGRASPRAVHDAMPLLHGAEEVMLFAIDAGAAETASLTGLGAHLVRHGVRVCTRRTVSGGVPICDIMLNAAADFGARLLVLGGYGHARLREQMLGGVTRDILRTMTVPVLLSH